MTETQVVAMEVTDPETGKSKIVCQFCSISFVNRGNLYAHLRKYHHFQVLVQRNQICPLCSERFRTLSVLHEHLQKEHSTPLKFVDETFYSKKDFLDWKSKIEKETQSAYRFRNSYAKGAEISCAYYICHRSGQHRIKQNRIRNIKTSGSIKTGFTCPAVMIVATETVDGITEIKVHYQSVHIGHDLETRTMRLSKKERENLAACLKLGIPFEKILEDVKQNFSPTNRYRHITRKHLHNICRDFGIQANHKNPPERKKKKEGKKKDSVYKNNVVEESDNSSIYNVCLEIEVSNNEEIIQEEVQEQEKTTAVSSLLQLRNPTYFEEIDNKKSQIINELKDVLTRIEKWDPTCSLPDIEEHIKAINVRLDISEHIK